MLQIGGPLARLDRRHGQDLAAPYHGLRSPSRVCVRVGVRQNRRVTWVPEVWSDLIGEQREKLELGNEAMAALRRRGHGAS